MKVTIIVEDYGWVVFRTERTATELRAKQIQACADEAIETLVMHGSYSIAKGREDDKKKRDEL